MGAAIALREDYDAADLRRIAKGSKDAAQSRRLLSLAEIYAGGRRTDAARIGATDLQVIRDWVLRFNALGPSGLLDRKAPGNPPKLDTAQRKALAAIVESGPIPAIHGVVRWRLADLRHWIWQEFAVSMDERSVGRILRAMNFVKMTARPRHRAQNEWALEDFKKLPRQCGRDPPNPGPQYSHRDLVPGRGPRWSKDQPHPALGTAGNPAQCGEGSTHKVGLYIRRHLPRARCRRRPRSAPLQYSGHAMASRRNIITSEPGCPCHSDR